MIIEHIALYVNDLEAARDFINSKQDVEGYLIYDDGGIMTEWASSGFKLAGK